MPPRSHDFQPALEGMPAPYRPRSRNSIARALRSEYIGLDPADYADITPDVMELASAENLRPSLIDVDRDGQGALGYRPHGAARPVFITVTPEEYGILAGSVRTLSRTATSRTQEARGFPLFATDEDRAAAQRAGAYAVQNKLVGRPKKSQRPRRTLQGLEEQLGRNVDYIERFQEAAAPGHIGLARGSEETMRMRLTYLRTFILPEVLMGVGNNRDWSRAKAELAQRAMEKLLFIERSHNQHIGHFRGMMALAREWNGHKLAMTRSRIWEARKVLRQNPSARPLNR